METAIIVVVVLIVLFILFRIIKAFLKWSIIILVLCLVVAYFTNPDEATHRESLKEKTKEESVKRIRPRNVSVEDYKIFSLTKANVNGTERLVGVGVFGKVWYFNDLKNLATEK
jgi:hypothetical protein